VNASLQAKVGERIELNRLDVSLEKERANQVPRGVSGRSGQGEEVVWCGQTKVSTHRTERAQCEAAKDASSTGDLA
jgi:hypothetical protein